MNRSLLLFITSLFSVSLSAQYSIDLSKIQYPSIEYLKMGNPGPAGQEIKGHSCKYPWLIFVV